MPRLKFSIAELKCAFWKWMPKQNFFAVDFGDTEETREETINHLWWHFVEILQGIEKQP